MSRESQERNRREAEIAEIEKQKGPEPKWLTGAGSFQSPLDSSVLH